MNNKPKTINIERTTGKSEIFRGLVDILNIEQAKRNGDKNDFYMQFNKLDNIHHVVIAFDEQEEPIGCGALREFDEQSMEVKRMFTKTEARGKGVATQILKELENWTAEMDYNKCVLETGTMNPEAIQFYKKHNYQQIKNFGQYAGDDDSLCFEKRVRI